MTFGHAFRYLREDLGLTLDQLAAKSKMSPAYLHSLEENQVHPPSRVSLFLFACLASDRDIASATIASTICADAIEESHDKPEPALVVLH